MTDKQMEEKKKEFVEKFFLTDYLITNPNKPLSDPANSQKIHMLKSTPPIFYEMLSWIAKLVEEVEREKLASFEEYIDLKVHELHKDSLKGKFESGQFWGFKEVQGELQKLLKNN